MKALKGGSKYCINIMLEVYVTIYTSNIIMYSSVVYEHIAIFRVARARE